MIQQLRFLQIAWLRLFIFAKSLNFTLLPIGYVYTWTFENWLDGNLRHLTLSLLIPPFIIINANQGKERKRNACYLPCN